MVNDLDVSASNFTAHGLDDPGTADRISRRQVTRTRR